MRYSHVYLIGPDEGPIKVGVATSLSGRLSEIQIGNWIPLKVHHSVRIAPHLAFPVENAVHIQFADKRMRGEWFDVPVAEAIKVLEETATSAQWLHDQSAKFSPGVCYFLADDPAAAQRCVALYRNKLGSLNGAAAVKATEAKIEARAGEAALLVFKRVVGEGRDLSYEMRRSPHLARQAETSLIAALNALVTIGREEQEARLALAA